jgi:anion-transporting  ArsA/GET3 family ATPase
MKEGQKNPEIRLKYDEGDDDILKRLKTLHQNYLALNAILQGRDCSIVLVFNPDMLALKESERLIEGLRELNLPLRLLIDNKVTEENREMAGRVEIILREKHGDDIPVKQVALSTAVACAQGNGLYDIPEDLASLV